MTQNSSNQRPKIALFEPDIPQNTAAIIRTCACLGAKLEIIEPCGFLTSDKRFKRVVMDYMDEKDIKYYQNAETFFNIKQNERIILMTTKASVSYSKFKFKKVHKIVKNRLKIPMENNKRSLNLASSVAIILAECLKQTKWI